VKRRLPIKEFVRRVTERYSVPAAQQLKARLIWAAAFQRAYRATEKAFGATRAWKLVVWYGCLAAFLELIMARAREPKRLAVICTLKRLGPEWQVLKESIGPLFSDDETWRRAVSSLIAADVLEMRLSGTARG